MLFWYNAGMEVLEYLERLLRDPVALMWVVLCYIGFAAKVWKGWKDSGSPPFDWRKLEDSAYQLLPTFLAGIVVIPAEPKIYTVAIAALLTGWFGKLVATDIRKGMPWNRKLIDPQAELKKVIVRNLKPLGIRLDPDDPELDRVVDATWKKLKPDPDILKKLKIKL